MHLFDFDGDLYGQRMAVEFVAKLREEQKFDGLEPLKAQMALDSCRARRAAGHESATGRGVTPCANLHYFKWSLVGYT